MPFQSENQRRFLWAKHPDIAQRWSDKYGDKPVSFKAVQSKIASKYGGDMKKAGAILASASRKASPSAKAKNPNLLKVSAAKRRKAKNAKTV